MMMMMMMIIMIMIMIIIIIKNHIKNISKTKNNASTKLEIGISTNTRITAHKNEHTGNKKKPKK